MDVDVELLCTVANMFWFDLNMVARVFGLFFFCLASFPTVYCLSGKKHSVQ